MGAARQPKRSEDGRSEDGRSEDGRSEDGRSEDGRSEDGRSETKSTVQSAVKPEGPKRFPINNSIEPGPPQFYDSYVPILLASGPRWLYYSLRGSHVGTSSDTTAPRLKRVNKRTVPSRLRSGVGLDPPARFVGTLCLHRSFPPAGPAAGFRRRRNRDA